MRSELRKAIKNAKEAVKKLENGNKHKHNTKKINSGN